MHEPASYQLINFILLKLSYSVQFSSVQFSSGAVEKGSTEHSDEKHV